MKHKKAYIVLLILLFFTTMRATAFTFILEDLEAGIDTFTKDLAESAPVTQTAQNQWAMSYIGNIYPNGPHLGLGLNASAATLDMTGITSTIESLGLSNPLPSLFGDNKLVFPSVTVDVRLGGFILPFDIGFTILSLDSSPIDNITKNALSNMGISVKYLAVGGDIRYAVMQDGPLNSMLSINAGFYYTGGKLGFKLDEVGAALNFATSTFTLGVQATAKFLVFVPYIGTRLLFTATNIDYTITPNWSKILGSGTSTDGFPENITGESKTKLQFYPQFYTGFALDLAVVDITLGISYTFISNVVGANCSFRFSI